LVEHDRDVTEEMEEVYGLENEIICPIAYHVIQEAQNKKFTEDERNQWPMKIFGNFTLYVTENDRIRIPPSLREKILNWFHTMLMHPGIQRMEETMKMNFAWPGMTTDVFNYVQQWAECQ
jgi:Integrase zinc binding domain